MEGYLEEDALPTSLPTQSGEDKVSSGKSACRCVPTKGEGEAGLSRSAPVPTVHPTYR